MRIALFDYKVIPTNPAGSCHLRLVQGLCREHEFTVFAVEFANPCPERVRFVRVPVPDRPLALLLHRLRTGGRFDLVQMVESNLGFGHVAYRLLLLFFWVNPGGATTQAASRRGNRKEIGRRIRERSRQSYVQLIDRRSRR